MLYALNATDVTDTDTYDDLQRLEIGSTYSKYYSLFVFHEDSTATDCFIIYAPIYNISEEDLHVTMLIDGKFQGWSEYIFSEYFKDFSKNELTEYARMPMELEKRHNSQYTEPMPVQDWAISDDTLSVSGYLCQKATCRFRGREYIAWFTMDIPVSNGPWKFGGLPGLIMKVYDEDKLFVYECVGIESHKQKYPIKLLDGFKSYNKTDRAKLTKLKKTIQGDYYRIVGLKPYEGRTFPKLPPYNPMELE